MVDSSLAQLSTPKEQETLLQRVKKQALNVSDVVAHPTIGRAVGIGLAATLVTSAAALTGGLIIPVIGMSVVATDAVVNSVREVRNHREIKTKVEKLQYLKEHNSAQQSISQFVDKFPDI